MLGNNLPLSTLLPETANIHVPVFGSVGDIHADTILLSWACMIGILAFAAIVRPQLVADGPGNTLQGLSEMLYDFTADIAKGQIGSQWRRFFPLIAGIFIFVLIANFAGILPFKALEHMAWWPHVGHEPAEIAAPSTDFNVTFGLAAISVLTYLGTGLALSGIKYIKNYTFHPMAPIEWLDLIIRPSTLALRLMMVITADELMRAAALMMVPVLIPTGVMAFEMFIGVIQAFVFALLTSIYIGLTVAHAEHEAHAEAHH